MPDFTNSATKDGLSVKLWRGERMCLIGMDVDGPEDDFVGFSIEVKSPDNNGFLPLRNRLNFSYDKPASEAVNGYGTTIQLRRHFKNFVGRGPPY